MSKVILPDNDSKFLEILIQNVRKLDPLCIINISSILHTHRIDIQTSRELHAFIFREIMNIHRTYGLEFKATEFIKNKDTIISFQLSNL